MSMEYSAGETAETINKVSSASVLAIFALGVAFDIMTVGSLGGAGTLSAMSYGGAVSTANTVAGWTHDLAIKVPEFVRFARLAHQKCVMWDTYTRLQGKELLKDQPKP